MRPLEQLEGHDTPYRPERPQWLGFACIMWFVSAPLTMFFGYMAHRSIISDPAATAELLRHNAYTLPYVGAIGVGLIGVIGLWRMRRWGLMALGAGFGAGQILLVLGQAWELLVVLLWLVPLGAGAAAWRSLR
ncbi:MAG: hypothetical protein H0T53_07290 [Herpetosiphonaceae bacterium]|nr:hypothetical protein [Herpetosiphonaceae bacterium]